MSAIEDAMYDRQFNREADKYFAPEILYCQHCEKVLDEDECQDADDDQLCKTCEKERDETMSQMRHEYEVMRELEIEQNAMMAEHNAYQAEQEALPEWKRDGYAERMMEQADNQRKANRENQA